MDNIYSEEVYSKSDMYFDKNESDSINPKGKLKSPWYENSLNALLSNKVILGFLLTIIILVVVFSIPPYKDFNGMYSSLKENNWCEIGSDGTWMLLDTNPDDAKNRNDSAALAKIEEVLKDLGFKGYTYKEMLLTSSSDGKCTETTGKYEVIWKYHPENGLEALFKIK